VREEVVAATELLLMIGDLPRQEIACHHVAPFALAG
jgi:hypothetical protein